MALRTIIDWVQTKLLLQSFRFSWAISFKILLISLKKVAQNPLSKAGKWRSALPFYQSCHAMLATVIEPALLHSRVTSLSSVQLVPPSRYPDPTACSTPSLQNRLTLLLPNLKRAPRLERISTNPFRKFFLASSRKAKKFSSMAMVIPKNGTKKQKSGDCQTFARPSMRFLLSSAKTASTFSPSIRFIPKRNCRAAMSFFARAM